MSTIRLPSRSRRWPLIVIGVLVLLAILFTALSGAVVDLLWYREIGQSSVFWTTIRTRFLLGLVFGLLFFGLLYANLIIARRIRPTTRIMTPDQEVLARVRDASDPYLRWLVPVGAGILALLVGIGVSGEWKTFLLWRGGSGILFGNPDPLFHRDPSFYIFTMPWLRFLQGWLFSSLVGVTIIVGIAHLLWGGIRPQAPMFADKVTPAARAHLSVLLGPDHAGEGVGVLAGPLRPADVVSRRGRRGVVHRREGAAAGAHVPDDRGGDLRDPVLPQHPPATVEPAGDRRRVAAPRLGPAGDRLPGVRAAVPRQAERTELRNALHQRQHHGDERGLRAEHDPGAAAPGHRPAHRAADPGQQRDGLEHPGVARRADPGGELPVPPAATPVLQLRRRRRRPLQDRRPGAGADGLAARDRPGRDSRRRRRRGRTST